MRHELVARALRLARDRAIAEDLVQETFERALRFETTFLPGTSPRAWAFQILFSVFVTRARRRKRESRALAWLATDPLAWPRCDATAAEPTALGAGLRARLDALPEPFRRAVELVDLEERSYRDAADAMRVPVGTVMSRLHRGRRLLASALGGEGQALAA
jgi:RNA polymerase sigma-70 factor (ECF subfamily)